MKTISFVSIYRPCTLPLRDRVVCDKMVVRGERGLEELRGVWVRGYTEVSAKVSAILRRSESAQTSTCEHCREEQLWDTTKSAKQLYNVPAKSIFHQVLSLKKGCESGGR